MYYEMLDILAQKNNSKPITKSNENEFKTFYEYMSSLDIKEEDYMIKKIIDKITTLKLLKAGKTEKIYSQDKDIINNIKDFYNELDIDLLNIINETENSNPHMYLFLKKYGDCGECYLDLFNNHKYLLLSRSNTIRDQIALCHEYGHIIDFSNYKDFILSTYTNEVISYLMEMILVNYYNQHNYYKEQVNNISIYDYNQILKFAETTKLQLELFDMISMRKIHDFDSFNKYYPNVSKQSLNYALRNDYDYIKTIYSYFIAAEIFEKYRHNPQNEYKNIKKIIIRPNDVSIDSLLPSIGIDVNNIDISLREKQLINTK
jgi:hypothetical protein